MQHTKMVLPVPQFHIHPKSTLMDQDVSIQVTGLQPRQAVTVSARLQEGDTEFISCGNFVADNIGGLDLSNKASSGGTFTGLEPMGLFWSMDPAPGQRPGTRLLKKDVTVPYDVDISLHSGHLDIEYSYKNKDILNKTTIKRWYKDKNVSRKVIKSGRLRGTLFIPPGDGPFPGIIDVFGTGGGLNEHRAALLAGYGFAVFALAFIQYDDLPEYFGLLELEYFEEAVDWLSTQECVTKGGIGLLGLSKGAELMLFTASRCPKVKACAAINGFPFNSVSDHTYKGSVFHGTAPNFEKLEHDENGVAMFLNCYIEESPDDYNYFKVEDSEAHFLLINGIDDQSVLPLAAVDIPKRLKAHGKSNYEVAIYKGAGHLIEPPTAPLCRVSYHKLLKNVMLYGGEKKQHHEAQVDAWQRIISFFKRHLLSQENTPFTTSSKL